MLYFFQKLGVLKKPSLELKFLIRDHPYITSAKGLGGWGQKKWQFLLMFSTINANVKGGWVRKSTKSC